MTILRLLFRLFPIRGRHRIAKAMGFLFRDRFQPYRIGSFKVMVNLSYEFHRYMILGLYEEGLVNWIRKNLHPKDVVIDAGANIGFITAHALKTGAFVYAYEASHRAYYLPVITNDLDSIYNLSWENKAITQHVMDYKFADSKRVLTKGYATIMEINCPSDATLITVPGLNIDFHSSHYIKLVKLDIEGSELEALHGAKRMLGEGYIENVVVEHANGDEEVKNLLAYYEYRPHKLHRDGTPIPMELEEVGKGKMDVFWKK